jgi:hypothetical protein
MKPSNYAKHPCGSILGNAESEVVASNIMKILSRTGNEWREINFDEYKKERLTDGNYTEIEKAYFNRVINYCKSPETANTFCSDWANS